MDSTSVVAISVVAELVAAAVVAEVVGVAVVVPLVASIVVSPLPGTSGPQPGEPVTRTRHTTKYPGPAKLIRISSAYTSAHT